MGEARPLKLLNSATWLISTCLCLCPFCLRLGDCALTPCILATCVYMQRQRQEANMQRAYERGIKQISMIDMASKETGKQANKQEGKEARKQIKGGVCEGQM